MIKLHIICCILIALSSVVLGFVLPNASVIWFWTAGIWALCAIGRVALYGYSEPDVFDTVLVIICFIVLIDHAILYGSLLS